MTIHGVNENYKNKDWLRRKYVDEEWTTTQIAEYCGVSHKTISRYLERFGIPTRGPQEAQLSGERRRKREHMFESLRKLIQQ